MAIDTKENGVEGQLSRTLQSNRLSEENRCETVIGESHVAIKSIKERKNRMNVIWSRTR